MKRMKSYLGIDPGVNGGIACLWEDGTIWFAEKMPDTHAEILAVLWNGMGDLGGLRLNSDVTSALIENVSSSPQMGVVSAFTFGKGYGALLMGLTAMRIPFATVTPRIWQNALECCTGGDKNVSKRRAQQLFPTVKVTHAIADALLIAEFHRRGRGADYTYRETSAKQRNRQGDLSHE